MNLSELKRPEGMIKDKKILGRGTGSKKGKNCGYGNKGAKKRSGRSKRIGFEGGQTPLYKRLPKKKGFKPLKTVDYIPVNLDELESIAQAEKEIDLNLLKKGPVKVLGRGEIKTSALIKASAFSKSAKEKIEKIGGKTEVL